MVFLSSKAKKPDVAKKGERQAKQATGKAAPKSPAPARMASDYAWNPGLRSVYAPRLSEKGSLLMERGIYVMNVSPQATKREIMEAVQARYGVVPVKISVARVYPKQKRRGGKRGSKPGGKKAYLFLKKGDKIEIA